MPDGIAALDQTGTFTKVKRDRALFFEGDTAECYFKVVSGAVRGCKMLADGRRDVGDFFMSGDFIGLDASDYYEFTAEALADSVLLRYARRKVDALARQQPEIARSLVVMMRDGLAAARHRMTLLGHMTAMERIANFVLIMADKAGENAVSLPMSRTDIGDHLGLTLETVSRIFRRLRREGVIEQKSVHEIVIADRDALLELADVA